MATLPKMLELIQIVDGRDAGTLLQFGRVMREAGLIPAGKRGKGAPNMGLEHAANFLLGSYGAASPKDGPKAVANLRLLETYRFEGDFHNNCDVLRDIMEKNTFGEAIEELIFGVPEIARSIVRIYDPNCELSEEDEADWLTRSARGLGLANVRVRLHPTGAKIELTQAYQSLWTATYVIADERHDEYTDALDADRKPITEFSIRTLSAYFAALMEGAGQ